MSVRQQRIVHVIIAVTESTLESIQPIAVPVCKTRNPQLTFTSDCKMFIKFIEVTLIAMCIDWLII